LKLQPKLFLYKYLFVQMPVVQNCKSIISQIQKRYSEYRKERVLLVSRLLGLDTGCKLDQLVYQKPSRFPLVSRYVHINLALIGIVFITMPCLMWSSIDKTRISSLDEIWAVWWRVYNIWRYLWYSKGEICLGLFWNIYSR